MSKPPPKRPRLDSAVSNDDDPWADLRRFNDELPDELADDAFSAQIGFIDQSQAIATQNHQPSQLVSPSDEMPAKVQQEQKRQQPSTDERKRQTIRQQQPAPILHAFLCVCHKMTNGVTPQPCKVPHCQTMIDVLRHLSDCQPGKACTVPQCASSWQVIAHWLGYDSDCSICLSEKNSCERPGAASSANTEATGVAMHQSFQQQQQQQQQQQPRMVHPHLAQAYAALGLKPPVQQQVVSTDLGQEPLASSSALPVTAAGIGANYLDLPMSATTMPAMMWQNLDLPSTLELNRPGALSGMSFPWEEPNRVVEDWHQSVMQDLRLHLVHKIVRAIFPDRDPALQLDKLMMNVLWYAFKVEGNMYKTASSQEDYYHLLSVKVHKIQTDLDEMRRKKIEQKRSSILVEKTNDLRQELYVLRRQSGHCHVEVSRDRILVESCHQIMNMKRKSLRKPLMVTFHGEEGLDYGGVARDWLYRLSHEILNPSYGLFQYSSENTYTLQINPDSGINPEHLLYFRFVGRIIGLAIFHELYLDGRFTMPFYKQLLGKSLTLDDLKSADPDLHRSLVWMLDNDITGIIDHGFCVDLESFGERIVHDLKPGGRDIPVTEENKSEYVELYVNWRLIQNNEIQFLALQKGFRDLISRDLLLPFDEQELELVIGGLQKIDVEDWKENTCLEQCTADSDIVKWFWRAVEEFDEERRARLLQFVTGSARVPLQGFKALQGSNQSDDAGLFTIYQVDSDTDSLPMAHTCFNRIDIPPYESYEKFLGKLTCAVEETCGFMVE